jgi:hypothetical protein
MINHFRTVISQLKKDFLNASPPKPVEPQDQSPPEKKTNKYLKTENRWTGPPGQQPPGTNGVIQDTVQAFQAPQIHHAEVVTLRQDTSSESDDDGSNEPPSHMLLQSPMVPMPKSVTNPSSLSSQPLSLFEQQQQQFLYEQQQLEKKFKEEQDQLRREQEELMKKQQELFLQQQQYEQQYHQQFLPQQQQHQQFQSPPQFPQQQQYQSPQQFPPQKQPLFPQQQQQQKQQLHYPAQQQQPARHQKNNSSLDRSFEDPAYANFQSSMGEEQLSSPSTPPSQEFGSLGKKKGFFSSFFKKPSPSSGKKGRGSKGKRPRSEYVPDDEYEDDQNVPESGIPKSQTDGDLRLNTLERSPMRLSPVVPQPGSSPRGLNQSVMSGMHKNESMITHPGMSFEQELDPSFYDQSMGESFSDEPLPQQPLQRKLSMSKPTDLDELMRLQDQVSVKDMLLLFNVNIENTYKDNLFLNDN